VTFAFSGPKQKRELDDSFQQLLAVAYTLQKHNDDLRAGNPRHDPAWTFSEIATLRSQILAHTNQLDEDKDKAEAKPSDGARAAALVAECLRRVTNADGASVSLIIDGYLRPTACSGAAAKVPGGSVASNSLVPTERLRNMQAFQSANVASDIRLDQTLCLKLQIGSLLAFPIQRQNEVAGIIELRWNKAEAFSDGDERICQLIAGLVGEALESAAEVSAPAPVASRTATPRDPTSGKVLSVDPAPGKKLDETQDKIPPAQEVTDASEESRADACRVCGKPLTPDDNFCGNCGMLATVTDHGLQGKWASMWFMQQAQKAVETEPSRSERLWPIGGVTMKRVKAETSAAPGLQEETPANVSENDEEIHPTDEIGEAPADVKRSSRSVLAVLKSRFKVRAMGQ